MQNPPPSSGPPSGKTQIGLEQNVAATLCYLTMFCCGLGIIISLIFFLVEKSSRFVRFHSLQGLLFGAVWIAVGIAFKVLYGLLNFADMGILGIGLWGVQLLVILVLVLFLILAAIKAYQGQYYKLPVLGDIAWNAIDKP
jgi:uncharacterized membrane protein